MSSSFNSVQVAELPPVSERAANSACHHLYGQKLFTWLSLVMSLMASFVLSFFSRDVLNEIWDLIESVSEGFPSFLLLSRLGGRNHPWF